MPAEDLGALRSDCQSLPLQAIECSPALITPLGEQWEEEALDEVDRLIYCSDWRPLVAILLRPDWIPTWPKTDPYDTSNRKNLDIGPELVHEGYAVELPEGLADHRAIPDMIKDGATETDASLAPRDQEPWSGGSHSLLLGSAEAASTPGADQLEDDYSL